MTTTRDKVIGMLLGVGIGDALGRCCEGMDCQSVKSTFGKVEKYIIQNGWLRGVAAVGPRIRLNGEVTAVVAIQLADTLQRLPRTSDDENYDALSGNSPGGMEAFCRFLRGGPFALVDGEVTDLEGGNDEQVG